MLDVQLHHWHAPSKLELKHHSCVILVQNRHYYNSIPFILFHSALPVVTDWHRCLGINVKGTTNQINNVSVETIANTESSWAGEQQKYQADVKAQQNIQILFYSYQHLHKDIHKHRTKDSHLKTPSFWTFCHCLTASLLLLSLDRKHSNGTSLTAIWLDGNRVLVTTFLLLLDRKTRTALLLLLDSKQETQHQYFYNCLAGNTVTALLHHCLASTFVLSS